jgi:hypothetical protein
MIAHRLNWLANGSLVAVLVALFLIGSQARGQEKAKDKLDLDKIPKAVMDALKSKFPKAEIHKWTKAKEGDDVVYDIEFKENGRKCEADIKENGTYINYEKEIAAKDLTEAVRKTLDKRYPKATLKEIMEITDVKGKNETLEGYEIVLEAVDKKEQEITIAPDGKVLEDTGEKKEDKQ